jgi:hypothetical protein
VTGTSTTVTSTQSRPRSALVIALVATTSSAIAAIGFQA